MKLASARKSYHVKYFLEYIAHTIKLICIINFILLLVQAIMVKSREFVKYR